VYSESLHILGPRRNLQAQGFAGRSATTTMYKPTVSQRYSQTAIHDLYLGTYLNVDCGCDES
jgi:hypothetical protein